MIRSMVSLSIAVLIAIAIMIFKDKSLPLF